jgi:hypothetical protein
MDEPDSPGDHDKREASTRELIRIRFANTVVLARKMIDALGAEKAHEIIGDAFSKDMEETVKKELHELGPVKSFEAFKQMEKEENESPEFRNIVTLTYPHESSTELSLHVTECLYAEVFKELKAEELGYLMVCNPDHAYAQTCHPRIKLRRSKTLMQGDSCCNHTWYWIEG